MVVSYKFPFRKQDFEYFVGYKDLYTYSFQKWAYIKHILIRLNVWFYDKRWKKISQIHDSLGKS